MVVDDAGAAIEDGLAVKGGTPGEGNARGEVFIIGVVEAWRMIGFAAEDVIEERNG